MKKFLLFLSSIIFSLFIFTAGFLLGNKYDLATLLGKKDLSTPIIKKDKPKELPLLEYSILNLKNYSYQPSQIVIEDLIKNYEEYSSFIFSYTTMDKKMTGQINIPHSVLFNSPSESNSSDSINITNTSQTQNTPTIIMIRGYVPAESYFTGAGTKNAAAIFTQNGYVTIAPDFFGYGTSDLDFEDSWKGRFIKPINIIELIESIKSNPIIKIPDPIHSQLISNSIATDDTLTDTDRVNHLNQIKLNSDQLGIWAHSNGGQIALATLEISSQPIPTTLWAPVTAPFPYSILFFTDELEDEGKASRAWVAMFEEDYDVFDFSLTQHLDQLAGPIQIQHGTADDAAIIAWSDEFVDKIKAENERRSQLEEKIEQLAESSPEADLKAYQNQILEEIDISYHRFPGANHNLQPNWNQAVENDLLFFEKNL